MKTRAIAYWATTALVVLAFAAGGIFDLSRSEGVLAVLAHLGYPAHLATVLGIWKLLGAAAIAVPGFPRLKEWAYAGMFFDLSGAAVAHVSAGDPVGNIATPLFILGLVLASWALRPEGRTLAAEQREPASPRDGAARAAAAA
jgi:uncharacterized membrane protein YphA (DoxX/SURF4 family)